MAELTPMPRASVITARAVNPGDFRSWRKAKRASFNMEVIRPSGSFGSQGDDWIDTRCAPCRYPRSQECGDGEKQPDAEINAQIDAFDFEKYTLQRTRKCD